MGYSTEFDGDLKFTTELTAKALAKVKSFFGEDCRDHTEWDAEGSYIDLKFNDDFTGIKWDDATEKNNGMISHINLIIRETKKEFPEFGLAGQMTAQGEDPMDRWYIVIEDGKAIEGKAIIKGKKITCPHCDEEFLLDEDNDNSDGAFTFVFTGFRDESIKGELEDAGHKVADGVSKSTTHLIMKDTSKESSKKAKALKCGCKIWSLEQLNDFIDSL